MGSVNAVVAAAFTADGELVTVASVGGRAEDILDVVESRDAREPGRNGEDVRGREGVEGAGGIKGGDAGGIPLGDSDGDDGGGCGCGGGEGSGSEIGGGVAALASDDGTTVVCSSDGSGDA